MCIPAHFIPFLHFMASHAPALWVLHFVPQPIMVFPCLRSQPSSPVLVHGTALLHSLCSAPFHMAALISCALFHCGTTHSFATPLRCAYSSFSRALPCPQGFHIVHVRPPAAHCGCGCIFVCLLNNIKCIAALWVQVCPTGGRQAKQKIALRITVWCLPVRSSQSRPQPAVGYGAGRRISDTIHYVRWSLYISN